MDVNGSARHAEVAGQLSHAYAVVNANRGFGQFLKDITYDGLAITLLQETDQDGLHLIEIRAALDGTELHWIPRHIAALMKATAQQLIQQEDMS